MNWLGLSMVAFSFTILYWAGFMWYPLRNEEDGEQ